jgi:hypothetical protein
MPEPSNARDLHPTERLLVLAAIGEREVARAAWSEWQQIVSLDDTDAASFAVLPAVSRNLDRHAIEHTLATRLRGIYRYSWSHSQVTFRDLSLVHQTLTKASIRAVSHKGLAVAARYLGDLAAIASDQVDLLIAAPDVERAADALAAHGWRPVGHIPPLSVRPAFDAHSLEGANRRRVVLRWRSFPLGCPSGREHAVVDRADAYSVQGAELLTPQPTDQLLLACASFSTLAPAERVRWTVETCAMLRGADTGIDHGAFAERAADAELLCVCEESLAAIRAAVGIELPSLRFPRLPLPGRAPRKRNATQGPPRGRVQRVVRSATAAWQRYSAVSRSEGVPTTPWGFVRFARAIYRHEWEVPATGGLARAAARRLLHSGESSAAGRA